MIKFSPISTSFQGYFNKKGKTTSQEDNRILTEWKNYLADPRNADKIKLNNLNDLEVKLGGDTFTIAGYDYDKAPCIVITGAMDQYKASSKCIGSQVDKSNLKLLKEFFTIIGRLQGKLRHEVEAKGPREFIYSFLPKKKQ